MGDYWIVAACVLYASAVFLPLFFLSPAAKARYLPVPFVAIAIGLPTLVIWGMELAPYFYFIILLMLWNACEIVSQARVCPQCGAISGLQRGHREIHHCPVLLKSARRTPESARVAVPAVAASGLPPRGYEVQTSPNGDLILRYRTTGMGCLATFFALFIVGWTLGCIVAMPSLLQKGDAESYLTIALLWLGNAWVAGYATWLFFSRWTLVFSKESLVASRVLGPIVRRRHFTRSEIRVVQLVRDGGDHRAPRRGRRDTFPSWAVVVNASQAIAIVNHQGWEQAAWLGRFLSDWSGAPLEDLGFAGDLKYKRL